MERSQRGVQASRKTLSFQNRTSFPHIEVCRVFWETRGWLRRKMNVSLKNVIWSSRSQRGNSRGFAMSESSRVSCLILYRILTSPYYSTTSIACFVMIHSAAQARNNIPPVGQRMRMVSMNRGPKSISCPLTDFSSRPDLILWTESGSSFLREIYFQ